MVEWVKNRQQQIFSKNICYAMLNKLLVLLLSNAKQDFAFFYYRTKLDGQCKKWRLFADILDDIAKGIELLVPYFSSYSVIILCISTTMKSIVGVAGGATRTALIHHQV